MKFFFLFVGLVSVLLGLLGCGNSSGLSSSSATNSQDQTGSSTPNTPSAPVAEKTYDWRYEECSLTSGCFQYSIDTESAVHGLIARPVDDCTEKNNSQVVAVTYLNSKTKVTEVIRLVCTNSKSTGISNSLTANTISANYEATGSSNVANRSTQNPPITQAGYEWKFEMCSSYGDCREYQIANDVSTFGFVPAPIDLCTKYNDLQVVSVKFYNPRINQIEVSKLVCTKLVSTSLSSALVPGKEVKYQYEALQGARVAHRMAE